MSFGVAAIQYVVWLTDNKNISVGVLMIKYMPLAVITLEISHLVYER